VAVQGAYSYFPNTGDKAIDITATNTGAVTVTLISAQLRVKGKAETLAPIEWLVQTPSSLPIVLEPGRHWTGYVEIDAVLGSLRNRYRVDSRWHVRPFVGDSAKQKYEADSWLELS
jgi:hypothetical protein